MFEDEKHFSHLSTIERELAFRTEMGLYYSYYKTIIEAPTLEAGLHDIMNDNRTEYPLVINTLKRFNLYPEVVLGMAFRAFIAVSEHYDIQVKQCWKVTRGEGFSDVQSCEGLGEPSYFYVECIFVLHGILMSIYFLFGTYLSGSLVGGVITVSCIFFNHGECTRIQWTPPLRESFAYPIFVGQMFLVTALLRNAKAGVLYGIAIAAVTICVILPWQFAQFILLTQTMAVFGTYVLRFIDSRRLNIYLASQAASLIVCYGLLFGNEMLLTSFYSAAIITVAIITKLEAILEKLRFRIVIMAVQGSMLVFGTVGVKTFISKLLHVADDAHIMDILRSKFTNFKSFHTMLYTCATEFDFLEFKTLTLLCKTLLIPSTVFVVLVCVISLLVRSCQKPATNGNGNKASKVVAAKIKSNRPDAEVVYHLLQLAAFTVMALLIMRLKLFWTPHLCLISCLLASRNIFGWIRSREIHFSLVTILLGCMAIQGYQNIQVQMAIKGEFSNHPMEELLEWINTKTPPGSVFGGPMSTMATIKLCTNQPIVNHPHYEDVGLRERTKKMYSIFSRKPPMEVHHHLRDLKVDYAIMNYAWCKDKFNSRSQCTLQYIWDIEDPTNYDGASFCEEVTKTPAPYFRNAFQNRDYHVIQVLPIPPEKVLRDTEQ